MHPHLRALVHSRKRSSHRRRESDDGHPYHFDHRSYQPWTRTEHGRFEVLGRFGHRSDLLLGIDNYRIAVLEAEPETFILPSHWDAEEVFYVIQGCGVITLIHGENHEAHEIRRGDVMRVPAGAIVYAINKSRNDKLRIALLLQPVSIPGRVQEFFGACGRNPHTFYTSFSDQVLEASFNTPMDKLERLFTQQRKGEIIKIIKEAQIRALSQPTISAREYAPYNLLGSKPSYSNEHGQLHEANSHEYHHLRRLDVQVSIANISQGAMWTLHYNTRSTQLAMVIEGSGLMEMVCPYQSGKKQHGKGEIRYRALRSQVSLGSVFVIPAGYAVAAVAREEENLQVLCFGVRGENNSRQYLAGRNNVLSRMEKEAKELGLGVPAQEVERVLEAQPESTFVPGPKRRKDDERERGESP